MVRSFFAGVDPNDAELRAERIAHSLPFSRSPFTTTEGNKQSNDGCTVEVYNEFEFVDGKKIRTGKIITAVPDVPYSDLLLDLAMACVFSSLTNNTKISSGCDAVSYVAFFALCWWIWATQVFYNCRFRQEDWIHRFFVFLQLCVFGGLAAFTSDFNVLAGIKKTQEEIEARTALEALGWTSNEVNAIEYRQDRLPFLNSRGITGVLAVSRLLLLVQYAVVFLHAKRQKRRTMPFLVPLVTLTVSTGIYSVLYVGMRPGKASEIGKLFGWYIPVCIEFLGLFVEQHLPHSIGYRGQSLYRRYSTLMIVILGEGLNGIASVFRYVVGTVGLAPVSFGLMLSTGVIFTSLFTIYMMGTDRLPGQAFRPLTWSTVHFLYFAALILLLQGVENILSFSNLFRSVTYLSNHINSVILGSSESEEEFSSILLKLGSSWDAWRDLISNPSPENDLARYRWTLSLYWSLFEQSDALPKRNELTYLRYERFWTDNTFVNQENWEAIFRGLIEPKVGSIRWFPAAVGLTFVFLAILNMIQRYPRDRYAWGSVLSRFTAGFGYLALLTFNIGSTKDFIFSERGKHSLIWRWLLSDWMIPSLATTLVALVVVDCILLWFSSRAYRGLPPPVLQGRQGSLRPLTLKTQTLRTDSMSYCATPSTLYSATSLNQEKFTTSPNSANANSGTGFQYTSTYGNGYSPPPQYNTSGYIQLSGTQGPV